MLNHAGVSALDLAESCVEEDGEKADEDGADPPTEAQKAEHEQLVALLKARGAM